MKSHDVWMLRQPQRGLLFENVLAVPVHHAGAKHMLAAAGGNQRAQFLFGLLLGEPMQIEKQFRRIIPTAQLFQLKMADVGADIFRRAFGIQ